MQHSLTEVVMHNKPQTKLTKSDVFGTLGEAHYVVLSTGDI
ncbi:MAG: hypothetical protein JWN12_20 [Candidatus Saccharibacteria bacterium]|nr:hypothetical protein [Candidatus Saccharibacteria bacterium]